MNAFPDFSQHGYQISRELGYNSLGGRVTYLATKINTKKSVVIKQFQFAQLGASWAEYEAYEQEIKVLQNLDSPGIPRYLDSFQTDSGFCMVQEYKNAESAVARTFSPPDIKQIAIATLEILVYLQAQKPPIIHRDIKPENLLIDDELNVYLVDFGFARIGGGNIAASSVVKGTMGFMPPEQMFNRKLTKASDLYGLGITLICLLTGTKSADIGNLVDANYGIHFRHLVPPLQQGWMNWLETMVAPRIQDRYKSAVDALTALRSLDVSRLPKVRIERDRLQFTATEFGEKVTQTVTVSNPIPDTILAGRWEVAPHPNDPPHTPYDHPWIFFETYKFEGNEFECKITVDTSKLLARQTYQRQIILHANSEPDSHTIAIQVKTARLPEPKETLYLFGETRIFMFFFILVGWVLSGEIQRLIFLMSVAVLVTGFAAAEKTLNAEVNGTQVNWFASVFGSTLGITAIVLAAITFESIFGSGFGNTTGKAIALLVCFVVSALLGASVTNNRNLTIAAFAVPGLVTMFSSLFFLIVGDISELPLWIAMGMLYLILVSSGCWLVVYKLAKAMISAQLKRGFFKHDAVAIAFLAAGFWISLGAGLQLSLKWENEIESLEIMKILAVAGSAIAPLIVTAIPLLNLIVFKRNRIIAEYRKSEPNLIKP
ncbi:serine/threonine-protein kinase [Microcoleus vaginatus]|uniref:serine/threonine-protein kinase n=1 Tax=Microcoleus vaginatus TaxID=119532 RepID=UPI001683F857|nr:serine/threonine protein kinase [Microcoleus sp. FACHB-84]MBD2010029.1 serine/threonine protein kinase [Microcoleus sp. FACHB-45]